ncbi:MAG: ABC transporter substrate binding protein [Sedimentisphaerales bacterium]
MKLSGLKAAGVWAFGIAAVGAVVFLLYLPCHSKPDGTPLSPDPVKPSVKSMKVLIVHSYNPEYVWVQRINTGIMKELADLPVEMKMFYMYTKRKSDEALRVAAGKEATKIVAEWKPDIVIASDDAAQRYFASRYAGDDNFPIVFCGVNGNVKDYGYPASNVTGVLERPYFEETLKFLAVFRPKFKRIAIISEDSSTSELDSRFVRTAPPPFEVQSYTTCKDFDEWQKAVKDAQDKADAIGVCTYHAVKRTGTNENMPPAEIMRWTLDNSALPVVGFLNFVVEDGALCGVVESAEEQGLRAGQLAKMILGGRKASEFPIVEQGVNARKMLNIDTAQKLGIAVPDYLYKFVEIVHTGGSTVK